MKSKKINKERKELLIKIKIKNQSKIK